MQQNYLKYFDKYLNKQFLKTYGFCCEDINKLILSLRKGIFPYKYMDGWEKVNETSLPRKEYFYSSLNMEEITNVDHRHTNRVFKNFNNKNKGDYSDLYVQSDTLLLLDVFENFRNNCNEVHELDPARILFAPALAWQACLKGQR